MACADRNDEPNDAQTKRRDDMKAPFLSFVRVAGRQDIRIVLPRKSDGYSLRKKCGRDSSEKERWCTQY